MANDVTAGVGRLLTPRVLWAGWLTAFAVYTYLLVVPNAWLPPWLRATVGQHVAAGFTLGKVAHATAYAVLTATTFLLPMPRRARWMLIAGLVLHVLQTAGVGRDRPAVAKGLAWLRANQAPTGEWRCASVNKKRDPATHVGKFMSDAATAYAALALVEANARAAR